MSNNIIVLSSDDDRSDEGDNTIDPWVMYSRKTEQYSENKPCVLPNRLSTNDPFQIGMRYTTPLIVTPFKDGQTKYGNSPIGLKSSVGEGLTTTSSTDSPHKLTNINDKEGQRTTSLSSVNPRHIFGNAADNDMSNGWEGTNTTSPIVIQKGYLLKEVVKGHSGEGFATTSSTVRTNVKDHSGEGLPTTSSTMRTNDNVILVEKGGHCATSSTKTQLKDNSNTSNENITGESFSHSSIISIFPNEKPRDAYQRYVEAYHNISPDVNKPRRLRLMDFLLNLPKNNPDLPYVYDLNDPIDVGLMNIERVSKKSTKESAEYKVWREKLRLKEEEIWSKYESAGTKYYNKDLIIDLGTDGRPL